MPNLKKSLIGVKIFFLTGNQLAGKNILVTAGPTYEQIDPVRFIGNHSSGKMGIAIANQLVKRGANVTLVIGPTNLEIPGQFTTVKVTSAAEMFEACTHVFEKMDMAIMSAAVADYTPVAVASQKIKKKDDALSLELVKTKDILKHLGSIKKTDQVLVGFALETNNEKENARKKLQEKNADLIVLNSLNDSGAGFGHNTNKITIFDKQMNEYHFETKSKNEVASDIVNTIIKIHYAK